MRQVKIFWSEGDLNRWLRENSGKRIEQIVPFSVNGTLGFMVEYIVNDDKIATKK